MSDIKSGEVPTSQTNMHLGGFSSVQCIAFWLLLVTHLAFALPLLNHEVEPLQSERPGLRRRQLPTVAITGITAYGVQSRLEIRDLQNNVDQWNIFVLGLARFQQTNQSDITSYYSIAGIHGRPYIPWDNVPPAPGIANPGYCAHVLNIFLAWHRPYLALFEQTLYQHIIEVVNEFPAWRFPYWDWAAPPPSGQSAFPEALQSPTINVTMPNGTAIIPNPLYSYQFHPVSVQDFYFNPVSPMKQPHSQLQAAN